jgi:gentisate 1,2-dioxygenase
MSNAYHHFIIRPGYGHYNVLKMTSVQPIATNLIAIDPSDRWHGHGHTTHY